MQQANQEASRHSSSLFAEAERQLNICNSCRYCEGYCAVFPAMERLATFSDGGITHLANLCHDCRDCYYACMYSPPHAFAINPPQIFSEIRRTTYDGKLGSSIEHWPSRFRGWRPVTAVIVVAAVIIAALSVLTGNKHSLWPHANGPASPYSVISYGAILVVTLIPFLASVYLMLRSAARYWRHIDGSLKMTGGYQALYRAISYAGDLRYLKGGGAGCAYPEEEMSQSRRYLHAATFYGFIALLISTMSAAVIQDILGSDPPYRLLSVPAIFGVGGGLGLVAGCTSLLALKLRANAALSDSAMIKRDYGLLIGLDLLGVTGLLAFALRTTPVYAITLAVHLALVLAAFVFAIYSKFVHFIYRFLSIVKDNQANGSIDD